MLRSGEKAPKFVLSDRAGKPYALDDFAGQFLVLFFYPKDNTPGCTIEAKGFSALESRFRRLKAAVVGISGGNDRSKASFCEKYGLKTVLLSDPDFAVSKKYGVYGKKNFMGRCFMGIKRCTFVIDPRQRVCNVFEKVTPAEHPQEVLDWLTSLERD